MKNKLFNVQAAVKILQHNPDRDIQACILEIRDSFITGAQSVQEINSHYGEIGIGFSYTKDEGITLSIRNITYRINGPFVSVETSLD